LNGFLKIGYTKGKRTLIILIGLSLITGIEAVFEMVFEIDLGNLLRFVTGSISGYAIGTLLSVAFLSKVE